jgi:hypothetical protein
VVGGTVGVGLAVSKAVSVGAASETVSVTPTLAARELNTSIAASAATAPSANNGHVPPPPFLFPGRYGLRGFIADDSHHEEHKGHKEKNLRVLRDLLRALRG